MTVVMKTGTGVILKLCTCNN